MKVCIRCGGTDLMARDWINPNTKEIIGNHLDLKDTDVYCNDCGDYTGMTERPDTPEEKYTPLQ